MVFGEFRGFDYISCTSPVTSHFGPALWQHTLTCNTLSNSKHGSVKALYHTICHSFAVFYADYTHRSLFRPVEVSCTGECLNKPPDHSTLLTAQHVTDDQESDIHDCAAVEKLSDLKRAVEDNESPIMRQVFSWLFPFGPGWNAGPLIPVHEVPDTFMNVRRSSGNILHQLVRLFDP